MLTLTIPKQELFNEATEEFVYFKETTIRICHSLVAISKWESLYKRPFLTNDEKTNSEILEYIRCMTITQNVPSRVYSLLTKENLMQVSEYLKDPMTATILPKGGGGPNREVITSELIYYWMVAYSIPFECQKWHINRLLTLINIADIKNQSPKKRSRNEILERNRMLNEQRKQALKTKG